MAAEGQDRLISASEVERWSYCPMSWKLERSHAPEEEEILARGKPAHDVVTHQATEVIKAEKGAEDAEITTWAYISLSIIFLFLGVSLAFLTSVGFISLTYWRAIILGVSIFLVGLSVALYFHRSRRSGKMAGIGDVLRKPIDKRSWKGLYPILFFLFGIVLLVNGFFMLRPFGIGFDLSTGVMSISLIAVYIFLLVNTLLHFIHHGGVDGPEGRKLRLALVLGLFLAISILIILLTGSNDIGTPLGYTMLILSLVWFLAAVIYDIVNRMGWHRKKDKTAGKRSTDLSIVMMAIMATFFTASTFLAREDSLKEYYFLAFLVAALWMMGALFFFFVGVVSLRSASKGKEELSIPENGRIIEAYDIDKGGKDNPPLVSERHFLIGSPDMIIEEDGVKIPVEVKSGRIPPKPHFSHIMQLGAYLILIDENFGQVTPYGYIEYRPSSDEKKRFTEEWDMMTKALVLSKVSEIRDSERSGVAHRNHKREGKCRNCSRRSGCPEKIV